MPETYVLWLYDEAEDTKEEIAEYLNEELAKMLRHGIVSALRLAHVPDSITVVMERER